MNKKLKEKIINKIDTIYNWNLKLADYYENPKQISNIRNIFFQELNKLREIIGSEK